MNKQDDFELLSQYIDGELDRQTELTLKQRLLAEPELNQQFRKLKALNTNIKDVMPDYADEPISDDLAALLAVDDNDDVVPLTATKQAVKTKEAPAWYRQHLPLAASVLFVMVLGSFLVNQSGDPQQVLPDGYNLSAFKSNVQQTITSGGELIIVQSFLDADEQFCREYFAQQKQRTEHGVSCFEEGKWQKKVYAVEKHSGQEYMTANGVNGSVDAFLQQAGMIKLTAGQELEYLKATR